ncbi:MAG: ABC-F family ATP-binding cassette domain-containing protein, partial [Odoribacter sp.]|nr:ABC-F family ATP-binding cassette domain-containing protein [Odoribacter sp.]
MIAVNGVSVMFGGFTLFDSISFQIDKRDRIGLTGRNGAGKSTLLKIIAGENVPTEGSVAIDNDCKIGYLPQTIVFGEGTTVRQEAAKAYN